MKTKIIGISGLIGLMVGVALSMAQTFFYIESYYFSLSLEAAFPFGLGFFLAITDLKAKNEISIIILLIAGITGITLKGIFYAIGYRYGVGPGAFYDGVTIPVIYMFLIGQTLIILIIISIGHLISKFRKSVFYKTDKNFS